jgi:hypothetical protein
MCSGKKSNSRMTTAKPCLVFPRALITVIF